jgi:peptidoglycan/LPS O-acetylase OafA/YrhL
MPAPLNLMSWLARLAVIVFFVLSGFAIATSIKRHVLSNRWDWKDYAIRRTARIYPPYIAAIVLVAALVTLHKAGWTLVGVRPAVQISANSISWLRTFCFFYTANDAMTALDGPSWSLRLEVALYIAAGLITLAWLAHGVLRHVLLGCVVVLLVVCFFHLSYMVLATIQFASGALAASLINGPAGLRSRRIQFGVCVVLTLPLLLPTLTDDSAVSLIYQASLGPIIALGLISLTRSGAADSSRFSRVIVASGGWSYTLYIMHVPILSALQTSFTSSPVAAMPWFCVLALYMVLINGICWFIALGVERPSYYAKLLNGCIARVVPTTARKIPIPIKK